MFHIQRHTREDPVRRAMRRAVLDGGCINLAREGNTSAIEIIGLGGRIIGSFVGTAGDARRVLKFCQIVGQRYWATVKDRRRPHDPKRRWNYESLDERAERIWAERQLPREQYAEISQRGHRGPLA